MDKDKIVKIALEITPRIRQICQLVPKENEHFLKHLAAAGIHLAFFMRDFSDDVNKTFTPRDHEGEQNFLNTCGCKNEPV